MIRIEALMRNVRHAVRGLRRTPGFTITVVLTLALGIGANSAVFSAIDAVLVRALPFPDPDRLVSLDEVRQQTTRANIAPVRLEDWNELSTSFEAVTGYITTLRTFLTRPASCPREFGERTSRRVFYRYGGSSRRWDAVSMRPIMRSGLRR